MSVIAFEYLEKITAAREGVEALIRKEVFQRHERSKTLLTDSPVKYSSDGILSRQALEMLVGELHNDFAAMRRRGAGQDLQLRALCRPASLIPCP